MKVSLQIEIDTNVIEDLNAVRALFGAGVDVTTCCKTSSDKDEQATEPAPKKRKNEEEKVEQKAPEVPKEEEEVTEAVSTVTSKDIRILAAKKSLDHRDAIMAEYANYGATGTSTLQPKHYDEFYKFLTSLS